MNTKIPRKILLLPHCYWPRLPQQWHIIRNTSYHYGTIICNDFTYSKRLFRFQNRLDRRCPTETTLSTCDIKLLCTNIRHNLFDTAVEHWIEKLQNDFPLLRRFNKQIILEGLSIIFEFNYFLHK